MAQQAGIYKIDLYENNGVLIQKNNGGIVKGITNTGETINIVNDDQIQFSIEQARNRNNRIGYIYELEYYLYNLNITNINQVLSIKQSIYGWLPVIYYQSGETYLLNEPLIFDSSETPNESNHYRIKLMNKVPVANRLLKVDFTIGAEGIGFWIIETDFVVQ